ncbi:EndoU domain-containing protein [Sorangium sp. So ce1097]|uniref:EndoU domain-containing protein n=1 Tax=Sorangium sp. So ce1097 TaxID=3133330 RepID=UPI003F64026D
MELTKHAVNKVTGSAPTAAPRVAASSPATSSSQNLANPQRTKHILTGDATGGGHLWPGAPGKTPFPRGWSGEKIMQNVSDIATDPSLKWVQQTGNPGSLFTKAGDPARFTVIGEREGVRIKVVLEPAGEGIVTANPIP